MENLSRQNIKLIIMFILGLPGLPFACMMWVASWIVSNPPLSFKEAMTKEEFISFMDAVVLVGGLGYLLFFLLKWITNAR